ncbi:MAG: hypothetical protein DWQ07_07480 [Chloroflexi bacterium]|nr:MAG: hypothetical protein DWQ07_07480 [Chloroflexota bacterium]MBL1195457.1 hypothetical protein [Chloroflexota bacterium]NOH12740.1 hypothetical protein [Chloroflexota bacterium]
MTCKITKLDRGLLLITALLCAYQIAVGVDDFATIPIILYTITFGVLMVASLLILILGFEILENPLVVIVSTLVPLSLSTGLISQFYPDYILGFALFSIAGVLVVSYTLFFAPSRWAIGILILVYTITGLIIFGLPIYLSVQDVVVGDFALVGVGGALIGVGGILLSFLRVGKPILSHDVILSVLPALLLSTTAAFVAGFAAM